jgi:hypothetical protein
MQIVPSEVESIDEIGELNGKPVKMARLKGGLCIAIGSQGGTEEALAAGSHPAIVRYNVEKNFRGFQPYIMKSETEDKEVREHSYMLAAEAQKNGYALYSLKKNSEIEFVLTKSGVERLRYGAEILLNELKLDVPTNIDALGSESNIASQAIAHIAAARALEEGCEYVRVRENVVKASEVVK